VLFNGGIERIRFESNIRVLNDGKTPEQVALLQERLNRQFQPGTFAWVGGSIGQDLRNHPMMPSRGYQWTVNVKTGLPTFGSNFGFAKMEADATWFTPLIGESDLILLLHGHGGFVHALNSHSIPFRELFHLGGPATVRGFLWGQIGPSIFGDSLGGTKAFWVNAELIFNVTPTMRGVLFYDGGSSFDTPCVNPALLKDIRGNNFRFRHAIGFGIRLTSPTPLRVDWGFKLDRNKKRGEPISEVHFTMSQDF
jgi:outer membrane protein assembly factor BamA